MLQDSNLQIFLTLYHGSLIGTLTFDFIVRNIFRALEDGPQTMYVSNVTVGILFVAIIVWAINSMWFHEKHKIYSCLLVLVAIFEQIIVVSFEHVI